MGGGQSSSSSDGNSALLNVPDDLLIEILVHVPAKDIVRSCVFVCHHMRDIIASQSLWRRKCEVEGKYIAGVMPVPKDFKQLYFFNPYTRNLIKNPCALQGLKYWDVIHEGGDDFQVEPEAYGSKKISETDMLTEWSGPKIKVWATSYYLCEKRQIINLEKEGIDLDIVDQVKPAICVSEWYAARNDCACEYEIEVKLLTKQRQLIDKFCHHDEIPQWNGGEWQKIEHVFEDYKPGVRFIEFRHLGKDRQFWAGNYGSKFTLSTVRFQFKKKN